MFLFLAKCFLYSSQNLPQSENRQDSQFRSTITTQYYFEIMKINQRPRNWRVMKIQRRKQLKKKRLKETLWVWILRITNPIYQPAFRSYKSQPQSLFHSINNMPLHALVNNSLFGYQRHIQCGKAHIQQLKMTIFCEKKYAFISRNNASQVLDYLTRHQLIKSDVVVRV